MFINILIFIRPFISSVAFPYLNFFYSAGLILSLVIWLAFKGVPAQRLHAVKYPLIMLFAALFISVLFSDNKQAGIFELYKYITGLLLFLFAASLGLSERSRLVRNIILAGFIIGILATYQYFFGFRHVLNYASQKGITEPFILDYLQSRRAFLPFITPNTLACYLATVIPPGLSRKDRICILPVMIFALLLTKSLGGIATLTLIFLIYICAKNSQRRKKAIMILGLIITIIVVLGIRLGSEKQHLQPLFSIMMRLSYWREALGLIKMHPFIGIGPGNFDLIHSRYAHNSYLQIWAETGIFSLISFFWFIAVLIKSVTKNTPAHKEYENALFLGFLVFLIHNIFDFSFSLPEVSFLWWIFCGLLL